MSYFNSKALILASNLCILTIISEKHVTFSILYQKFQKIAILTRRPPKFEKYQIFALIPLKLHTGLLFLTYFIFWASFEQNNDTFTFSAKF